MDEQTKEFRPTFSKPDKFERDEETGYSRVDAKGSEEYILLEALGQPRVFYAMKANRYFKDGDCTKEFSNSELESLNLPLPTQIQAARTKLIDELVAKGVDFNRSDVYAATAPSILRPRADIDKRLYQPTYEEKMIQKLNQATLGK